ncbi:RNA-guided endonuclease TnpB family protein [Methanolobus vulcani]|uniref:IS200/IS605 family element transposase accessory protein TnpB n=1 Tax=Methanolobus vulcani TaxID=38026 RepID=A0A7Z8KPH1_9EURY|nr:RNA-guided endonuclease TnpB family protein [Methanolobus vulcani]TQD23819.1 IS200/IS605 family element transposase accessory protein TnpB [Methanolobus vulcani]
MRKTYKFRIYPNKPQQKQMERSLEICRQVYNRTLAERKTAYEERGEILSKYTLNKLLPEWKKENPEYKEVFSQTLQEVQERVDLAFKHFFRRVRNGEKPGYPRFKGKGWYDSFTYPQMGFKLEDNVLYLSKIGNVRVKVHREIEGDIKRIIVRRSACKKWYVSITTECEDIEIPERSMEHVVGIDMGLSSFATLSDGTSISNPRFFRLEEKELAKAQRKLSKTTKGSLERKKAIRVVQRVHERIANKRYDFIHQLSRQLVDEYSFIAFEDLNIKNMLKNHCLAKSISDAAWNMVISATKYKAESAGSLVALVNPANTSKMCSRCGLLVEKTLADRTHKCNSCGLVLDRDHNAAINILRLGLQSVGIKSVEAHGL